MHWGTADFWVHHDCRLSLIFSCYCWRSSISMICGTRFFLVSWFLDSGSNTCGRSQCKRCWSWECVGRAWAYRWLWDWTDTLGRGSEVWTDFDSKIEVLFSGMITCSVGCDLRHATFEPILWLNEPFIVGNVLQRFSLHPSHLSHAAFTRASITVFVLRSGAVADLAHLDGLTTVFAGTGMDFRPCSSAKLGSLHHAYIYCGWYKWIEWLIISLAFAWLSYVGSLGSPYVLAWRLSLFVPELRRDFCCWKRFKEGLEVDEEWGNEAVLNLVRPEERVWLCWMILCFGRVFTWQSMH